MKLSPAQLNAYTTAECCSTAECYTAPPAVPLIGQKDTKPIPQQAAHRRNGRDWPVRYDEALPEVDKAANVGVITVVKPNWYEKVRNNANIYGHMVVRNSGQRRSRAILSGWLFTRWTSGRSELPRWRVLVVLFCRKKV